MTRSKLLLRLGATAWVGLIILATGHSAGKAFAGSGKGPLTLVQPFNGQVDVSGQQSDGDVLTWVSATGTWDAAAPAVSGDFLADGSVPMTGDFDVGGNDIINAGDVDANSFSLGDDEEIKFGALDPDASLQWSTAQTNSHSLMVASDGPVIVSTLGNRDADLALATINRPRLVVTSAAEWSGATDEYLSISHDGTDAILQAGSTLGAIAIYNGSGRIAIGTGQSQNVGVSSIHIGDGADGNNAANNTLLGTNTEGSSNGGSTVVGSGAKISTGAISATAIGTGAGATNSGSNSVQVGASAYTTGSGGCAYGRGAVASTSAGAYGFNANAGHSSAQVFGLGATSTAANQLIFAGCFDMFLGKGVTHTDPVDVSINGTGESGTDQDADTFSWNAPLATGTGLPGSLLLKAGDETTTGSALQTLVQYGSTIGAITSENNSATRSGGFRRRVAVEENSGSSSSPNVLTAEESGGWQTNEGQADTNHQNLPSAAAGLQQVFVVQDAVGIQVNAASGDTISLNGAVSASAGSIASVDTSAVVMLTAINDTQWVSSPVLGGWDVDGIPATNLCGSFYFSTPAETTLSAATPAKASGTTTAILTNGFTHSNNRLEYNGKADQPFTVTVTVGITKAAGSGTVTHVHIAQNGAVVTGLNVGRFVGTVDQGAVAVAAHVQAQQGDFFEIWIESTNGDNLTVEDGTLTITAAN